MRAFCWVLIGLSLSFASCALPGNSQEPDNEIYNRYCATCHGLDARGGNASTLFDDRWQFGDTDERIKANILDGIEENGMPGFRGVLTEAQAEELVATIRRMRGQPIMTTLSQPAVETTLDYELAVAHWIPADAGLKIPWAIDFLDPHTALVTERPGRLRMVINGVLHPDPISGTPRVLATGQGGLLDVAVDPDYAANGWVYLGYSHGIGAGGSGNFFPIYRQSCGNSFGYGQNPAARYRSRRSPRLFYHRRDLCAGIARIFRARPGRKGYRRRHHQSGR